MNLIKSMIVSAMALGMAVAFTPAESFAAKCYGCRGGFYVKYSGKDNLSKRKKARKACGCKVSGTTRCPSNRRKIKCSVAFNKKTGQKYYACKDMTKKSAKDKTVKKPKAKKVS